MQTWIIPAVAAGSIVFVVLLVLFIYFCKKAWTSSHESTTTDPTRQATMIETATLLLREQALDRFVLFQLNLSSICWSTEHNITHKHRALVYFRRFINILVVLLGIFAIGIADAIWSNWCCYPPGTSLEDLNQGTCWDKNAPVNNYAIPDTRKCISMSTWEWVSNVAFVCALFLSIIIHMYLSYHFVNDVRTGLEGSYTGMIDTVNNHDHIFDTSKLTAIKNFIWLKFDHHANIKQSSGPFCPHEINLHRLGHLLLDPFAILFGYPHIVLARSDMAIANFINLFFIIGTISLYNQWAWPRWQETCCFYDESTRSGRHGLCNDPKSAISHDPYRLPCNNYNTETTVVLLILFIELLVSFGLWFYTYILFHYILEKSTKPLLQKIDAMATTDEDLSTQWIENSPPPPYSRS